MLLSTLFVEKGEGDLGERERPVAPCRPEYDTAASRVPATLPSDIAAQVWIAEIPGWLQRTVKTWQDPGFFSHSTVPKGKYSQQEDLGILFQSDLQPKY